MLTVCFKMSFPSLQRSKGGQHDLENTEDLLPIPDSETYRPLGLKPRHVAQLCEPRKPPPCSTRSCPCVPAPSSSRGPPTEPFSPKSFSLPVLFKLRLQLRFDLARELNFRLPLRCRRCSPKFARQPGDGRVILGFGPKEPACFKVSRV